ncbi:succinylglutamate desuccinylase/aspartoacylase family protein [Planctomycetota bacterium]|nr:succinylglutamate desuccinylase/aspartoacylase family protein [Planctomycetota bacterium]
MSVAKLYTDTDICIPVHVIRSKRSGPTVFVSAAVHGDEINGIEIVRRLIQLKTLKVTHGTLILVPMVNVYGVLNQSRYMPDRRDLNRTFPGSTNGSLAGRVASIFLNEIVKHCDYGIDLHTGAIHRSNLPQIRANLKDPETRELAEVFGVPVLLNSDIRDGSLRQAAVDMNARVLLYEAGQALRFDEISIRAGVRGVLNVIAHLGMIKRRQRKKVQIPYVANSSSWVRANSSGIVQSLKNLGDHVEKGTPLADIGSPYGVTIDRILASKTGVIVGKQNIPLVQEGDAMFHIAYFKDHSEAVMEHIEALHDDLSPDGDDAGGHSSNQNDDH